MAKITPQLALKAGLVLSIGAFLLSRVLANTLTYYISARFTLYTLLAIGGLTVVGLNALLRYQPAPHRHDDDHPCDHATEAHVHEHYRLSWLGVALVLAPVILGFALPAQPLGAAALMTRELNANQSRTILPATAQSAAEKAAAQRTIADWHNLFVTADTLADFAEQPAKVVGFVYQDGQHPNRFIVARYVVSCCVADALVYGFTVQSPQAADIANNQWVEVSGRFAINALDAQQLPILVADTVSVINRPNQPYLYP